MLMPNRITLGIQQDDLILLEALNALQGLDASVNLSEQDASLAASVLGQRDAQAQASQRDKPVSDAIGDLQAPYRTPLRVEDIGAIDHTPPDKGPHMPDMPLPPPPPSPFADQLKLEATRIQREALELAQALS